MNLYEDIGGAVGEPISGDVVELQVGETFFVEITAEDLSSVPQSEKGVTALMLDVFWDPSVLREIDEPFDPSSPGSSLVSTSFAGDRSGNLDNAGGAILALFGYGFPSVGVGTAIGTNGPEQFSLLRFRAGPTPGDAALTVVPDEQAAIFVAEDATPVEAIPVDLPTIMVVPDTAPVITVGDHVLLPDTAGQEIAIHVSGGQDVQGVNFYLQMEDGGPPIQDIDILTGAVFAGNNTRMAGDDGYPDTHPLFEWRTTTSQSPTITADGLLATVVIDTTGFTGGVWKLSLDSATDFAGLPTQLVDGSIQISKPYSGDANMDGTTDVRDFDVWNAHKFKSGTTWRTADFNGDSKTDVRDFNIWNAHKFTSAPPPAPVDAVLEEASVSEPTSSDASLVELAWLHESEQSSTLRGPSHDNDRAEAALDKLLASYQR